MELWNVYDKNRKLKDKVVERANPVMEDGDYRIVVHFCLFNTNNQMLIQQRQLFKKGWSGMWDLTTGGSAILGEDSSMACEREVREELGLEVDLKDKIADVTFNVRNVMNDVFVMVKDVEIDTLKLQYEEVKQVKWASKEEIISMIQSGEFIPYKESFIELIFDIKDVPGNRKIFSNNK